MVIVRVGQDKEGRITSLSLSGHAGSGPKGHDLVCAGVSAVSQGALNAIDQDGFHIEVKPGKLELIAKSLPNSHDQIVLETVVVQLESLEASYPDCIRLERKCGK